MLDVSQEELESGISNTKIDAESSVGFVLKKLYEDKEHGVEDEVVNGLTFEELVGALLLAKEHINNTYRP